MTEKTRHTDISACLADQDLTPLIESDANEQTEASDRNSPRRETDTMARVVTELSDLQPGRRFCLSGYLFKVVSYDDQCETWELSEIEERGSLLICRDGQIWVQEGKYQDFEPTALTFEDLDAVADTTPSGETSTVGAGTAKVDHAGRLAEHEKRLRRLEALVAATERPNQEDLLSSDEVATPWAKASDGHRALNVDADEERAKLKAELLEHYSGKTPNLFRQFDAWAHIEEGDYVFTPDRDGDCVFSLDTFELMTTCPSVRVLIPKGFEHSMSASPATREDVLRLLDKVRAWIAGESDDDFAVIPKAEAWATKGRDDSCRLDNDPLAGPFDKDAPDSKRANADRYDLVIGLNNIASNDPCAICGERSDPDIGPELFLAGTQALVCFDCAKTYAPELNDLAIIGRRLNERRWIGDTGVVFEDVDRGYDLALIGLDYLDWAIARRLEDGCTVEVATRLCSALPKAQAAGGALREAFTYLYSGRGLWPSGDGPFSANSFLYIGAGKRYPVNGADQSVERLVPEDDCPF